MWQWWAVAVWVSLAAAVPGSGCGRVGFDPGCDDAACDAATSPYVRSVLADRPIAYFPFDEAAGPISTSRVGSATGTYEGAFVFGQDGAVADGRTCATFDGATTRIDLGDRFRFGGNLAFSVEVWINPSALGSTRFVFDRRTTGATDGYSMYLGDSFFLHARRAGGSEFGYVSTDAPGLGRWTHAVTTYDGAVQTLYVDGVEVFSNLGADGPIGEGGGAFVVGDTSPGQFFKFEGGIDELAIYDHRLPADRVSAHYQASGR